MAYSKLRQMRKKTGLSGPVFAQEAGLHWDHLYKLERGEINGNTDTYVTIFRTLAPHLNLTPGEVLAELTGVNETEQAA